MEGMNFREKKARIVWRTMSVDVTRVIPSRWATSVASGRLPGPGRAPDQEHERQVELAQRLQAPQEAHGLLALVLGEHGRGDVVHPLGPDGLVLAAAPQLALDQARQLVGALGRDARAHQGLGHQPLGVGEHDLVGDERFRRPAVGVHTAALAAIAASASASTAASRSRLARERQHLVVGEHDRQPRASRRPRRRRRWPRP